MADMSFVIRTFVFGTVLAVTMGQFGFPGMGFGGNPSFVGLGGGRGGGGVNPFFAARGGFRAGGLPAGGGFGGVGGGGFPALFQPPTTTTTTPRPTHAPLTGEQKKLADMLVKVIYQNHKKHVEEEKRKEAQLTPKERQQKKLKAVMDAAAQFNASH